MTRDKIIDVLLPEFVRCGMTMATAQRRLWSMNQRTLERELLLRGLADYDDPEQIDEDEDSEALVPLPAALGWFCAPVYLD